MFTPLLGALGALAILIYKLYGRQEHKQGVQVFVSFLAAAWLIFELITLPSEKSFVYLAAESLAHLPPDKVVNISSFYDNGRVERKSSRILCSHPLRPAEMQSNSCGGGGCVSLASIDFHPPKTCGYVEHEECEGNPIEKVRRFILTSYTPYYPSNETTSDQYIPNFNWPAHGRVIQNFGDGNDGINIALKEGTTIKAVASGEVFYAGAELKPYGNMILIRHEEGYVTAYAHNKDLLVRKGDKVKQGQAIASSGRTGNVKSSQLHFELRRRQTPIDPMLYLSGG